MMRAFWGVAAGLFLAASMGLLAADLGAAEKGAILAESEAAKTAKNAAYEAKTAKTAADEAKAADEPIIIGNGEALILRVPAHGAGRLTIAGAPTKWLDHPTDSGVKLAVIAAGYRQRGDIVVQNQTPSGAAEILIKIAPKARKSETIAVSPDKSKTAAQLPPKTAQRIKDERDEASKIYAQNGPFLFTGPFILPLNSRITSPYGTARVFNGELKSYHSGTDFRAATGTPLMAANDGVVVLAKERYYAGGSVIINHGGGIFTQYFHLSELKAAVGQRVKKGELIGLAGATGRVSGPHLHFGVMAGGKSVDPLDFISKINGIF